MKLYATVSSERASKGQGGNEYIEIVLTQEQNGEREQVGVLEMTGGHLFFEIDGLGVIFDGSIPLLAKYRSADKKGKRQKGEPRGDSNNCERCAGDIKEPHTCIPYIG